MTDLEKAATELIAGFDDLHSYNKPTALYSHIAALRAALAQQAEPVADKAQCDGGSCGVGGYCEQCPKQQAEPVVEPVAWYFQSFEDWWDSHGFHNAFEAGQIDGKPLAKLAWEVAREISAHQQPAPVVEPPKSFRVGYMTGYADGQRELREKQQADPTEGNPSF